MAALLHYNPVNMPSGGLKIVAGKKDAASFFRPNAGLRMEAVVLTLIPLMACLVTAALLHGWGALVAIGLGLGFLALAVYKIHEEWTLLHPRTMDGSLASGQQIVVGRVDSTKAVKNADRSVCNVTRYHFVTREGNFRSGMYLSTAKLPEAGEPILITYDVEDPKRIRIVESFLFYRIPATD